MVSRHRRKSLRNRISHVGWAWLLFGLIAIWLILLPTMLSAAEERIDVKCDETYCYLTHDQIRLIVNYVEMLKKRQGKSCT